MLPPCRGHEGIGTRHPISGDDSISSFSSPNSSLSFSFIFYFAVTSNAALSDFFGVARVEICGGKLSGFPLKPGPARSHLQNLSAGAASLASRVPPGATGPSVHSRCLQFGKDSEMRRQGMGRREGWCAHVPSFSFFYKELQPIDHVGKIGQLFLQCLVSDGQGRGEEEREQRRGLTV